MNDPVVIRVDLGEEYDRAKLASLFRRALHRNGLMGDEFLYHAFDGKESIDLVYAIGCDARDPQAYSCGTAMGLKPGSGFYNPLDTAMMLEKPGLLVYKKLSLVCIDKQASMYRFRGKNYWRGLVAILLAKRPRSYRQSDLHPDI